MKDAMSKAYAKIASCVRRGTMVGGKMYVPADEVCDIFLELNKELEKEAQDDVGDR